MLNSSFFSTDRSSRTSSTAFDEGEENAASAFVQIKLLGYLKNLVFVLALISLVVLTLVQGIQCVDKYLSSPTYISTEVVDQFEAEFPAMTICAGGYKIDVLKQYGYNKVSEYNHHSKWNVHRDPALFWTRVFAA